MLMNNKLPSFTKFSNFSKLIIVIKNLKTSKFQVHKLRAKNFAQCLDYKIQLLKTKNK